MGLKKENTQGAHLNEEIFRNLESIGTRENDRFLIEPFMEKTKIHHLNRTKYYFKFSEKYEPNYIKAEFYLPNYNHYEGEFELKMHTILCNNEKNKKIERYCFKALTHNPFKINGNYSLESFVERGDCIEIGFNKIFFEKEAKPTLNCQNILTLNESSLQSSLPILIEGETGTGKTRLAKQIHEKSGRAGNFIHLNLSSFSTSLLESELFGHIKGAFTGALFSKKGALLEAHKGTLFLDEIDSLSIDLQTKLLLFLDNLEFRAVGGEAVLKSDTRLIFASGSQLKDKIESGFMRKDFYFRLNSGLNIKLKSLRDEPQKIESLCHEFAVRNNVIFENKLIEFYNKCHWPGNVRQLLSHLQKKKILSEGKKLVINDIDLELMLENENKKTKSGDLITLEEHKILYCYRAFITNERNVTKTAKILEISPNTLKANLLRHNRGEASLRDNNIINIDF